MTFAPGYIQRIPADAASADSPVSSAEAWMTQHNLYHCLTQCSQCYVNWRALRDSQDSSMVISAVADFTARFALPFRATWWYPGRPARFKLIVKARTTAVSAVCHVNARVAMDIGAIGSSGVLLDAGGSNIPGATSSTVVDAFGLDFAAYAQAINSFAVAEDGAIVSVDAFMARVEIEITASEDEPEAAIEITGVSCWGF